jgi:hypothetical protein
LVGLFGLGISPSQGRYLHRVTSMPRVEFEPTAPVCERAKKVHYLDRVATVIGMSEKFFALILAKYACYLTQILHGLPQLVQKNSVIMTLLKKDFSFQIF